MDKADKQLDASLKGSGSKALRREIAKDATIQIRVSEDEKEEMQVLAKSMHLTLTDYLTRCHAAISKRLKRGHK